MVEAFSRIVRVIWGDASQPPRYWNDRAEREKALDDRNRWFIR